MDGPASPVADALRRRLHDEHPGVADAPDALAALWRGPRLETHGWPVAMLGELLEDGRAVEALDRAPRRVRVDGPGGAGRAGPVRQDGRVRPVDGPVRRPPGVRPDPTAGHRAPAGARRRRSGVEANARLTGGTAVVLLVLLAVEGLTILSIRSLLSVHVFVGMLLIPPVLLKIGSTTWRFAKYYLGDPEYRRKGPPPPLLRVIGPLVVVLTLTVLASGVALLLAPANMRAGLLLLHQGSFVVWLMLIALHVLGHLLDTARLAPRDWYHRTRRQVQGAGARQWAIATSVAVGLVVAVVTMPALATWIVGGHG